MKVSVICVSDRPQRLPLLAWSLVAQTHKDWELIVLDQSVDGGVARYCGPVLGLPGVSMRVERVERVGDWGYGAKHEAARRLATGGALIFPQDDAYYVPTALAQMVESLEQGASLVLCGWLYDLFGYAPMPPHPAIGHVDVGGFMVRREVFLANGWPSGSQTADGEFVEALIGSGITAAKCQGVLYVRT